VAQVRDTGAPNNRKLGSTTPTAKEETRKILDALPDGAIWEDIQYSIYVRERIERGQLEAEQEMLIDREEVEVRMDRWLAG
jgi:hypothetical protein